jgi:hypothetical protein
MLRAERPTADDRAGGHMPIDNSGKGGVATDVVVLVEAFDGALKKLQVNRTHPEALVVAKHLISIAKAGERDSARLRDLTVEAVQIERRRSRYTIPERVLRSFTTGFLATHFL